MIRFGLRLTLNGGKEAAVRLVITTVAVAVGVGMLLMTVAGINAVNAQNARYAWLGTGNGLATSTVAPASDSLWWQLSADHFDDQTIGRVDVAGTGPDSPVPPGIPQLPGSGQFYASPAMQNLLDSTPADQLGDRYGGVQIGTIGSTALPAPDSLLIIVGHSAEELSDLPGATEVASIATTSPSDCTGNCPPIGINANGLALILSVVAAGLLFPVLIFIGSATRLSAARREQRFAAMRLVGATPRQISLISVVESSVAAVTGVAAGFGLFFLLRPALAAIPFTGERFFPGDLSLTLTDVLLVAIGVPVAAAVAARLAMRRVRISPLGVSRRVTPRPPRAWRVLPLLAGIGELAYFVYAGSPDTTSGDVFAYLSGFLLILAGLLFAGPWLTKVGAGVMARRTSRPAVLIAARRLADNPRASFRAVSGLVLALFVTSVAIGVITTFVANRSSPLREGEAAGSTVVKTFDTFQPSSDSSVPEALLTELGSVPGVHGVAVIRSDPNATDSPGGRSGLISCAQLSDTPVLGQCPRGADTATIQPDFFGMKLSLSAQAATVWPAATVSADELRSLPAEWIVVGTDGSTSAVEQVRTTLEIAYSDVIVPFTLNERNEVSGKQTAGYQQLANVVILLSLPIAGCSLAVGVVTGLTDRRRPFSLLRLTGVPLGMLRGVVALENAVPLLLTAVISTGTGFLSAELFLRSQLGYTLLPPSIEYYLVVVAGLVVSLGVIASTLPLLRRITGPELVRNE